MSALTNGKLKAVDQGVNPQAEIKPADVALLLAIENRDLEAVSFAIDQGADPSVAPLLVLASGLDEADKAGWAVIQKLVEAEANIEVTDAAGQSLLHHAARCDKSVVIELLLVIGGLDVNARCLEGYAPLHVAAAFSSPYAIKWLLAYGADPFAVRDPCKETGASFRPIDAVRLETDWGPACRRILWKAMVEAEGEAA